MMSSSTDELYLGSTVKVFLNFNGVKIVTFTWNKEQLGFQIRRMNSASSLSEKERKWLLITRR